MMTTLLIILLSFNFSGKEVNSLERIRVIDLQLVNPFHIVQNENYILIYDKGTQQPFTLYDLETGGIIRFGSRGRGPGEIQDRRNEVSMAIGNNRILIHEEGTGLIHEYSKDGSLVQSTMSRYLMGLMNYVSGGGYIYNFTNSVINEELIRVLKLESGEINFISEIELDRDDYESLYYNSKNKQGFFVHGLENELYFGLLYSSLVFSASKDGNLSYTTFEPFNKELPPAVGVSSHSSGGIALRSPDAREHPFQYKGMAVNKKHLYGLYSGQQLTRMDMVRNSFGSNVRIGEGQYVVVFNRETGAFINKYKLDGWAAAIAADDDYIYALENSRTPVIVVYEVPER